MGRKQRFLCYIIIFQFILSAGCSKMIWQEHWNDAPQSLPDTYATMSLAVAIKAYNSAGDHPSVKKSIDTFLTVLAEDPANKEALTHLSNLSILRGTAFTENTEQKQAHFLQAMKYSELAMFTNPLFRQAMQDGKKPWEATSTLGAGDAPAMLFWVTAIQYNFKETMSLPEKIINVGWLIRCLSFLDRIKETAPDFGHGSVEFAYTVCYCALPSLLGGDSDKCHAYMDKAIEKSNGYLFARWARGKYFHQVTGDGDAARHDLEWVAQQDINNYQDAYPWRIHFSQDAAIQLHLLNK